MSKKKGEPPPIAELQREIDTFKFKIDDLCENELPQLGVASPDRLHVYNKANVLKRELSQLDKKLNHLTLADAEIPVKSFEKTKTQEKRRLDTFMNRLEDISNQLEPDEVEEDYFATLSDSEGKRIDREPEKERVVKVFTNEELDGREEEEFEDVEYYSDYVSEEDEPSVDVNEDDDEEEEVVAYAEGLTNFTAEDVGDLSFLKGEVVMILEQTEDGWWPSKNLSGGRGVVPSTLIKLVDRPPEMSTERRDVRRRAERENITPPMVDGQGNTESTATPKRSGKELWGSLREKREQSSRGKVSVVNVLKALKSVPSGFRQPTLGNWYEQEANRISTRILPKTTPSGLELSDLQWDAINKTQKKFPVTVCRDFTLVSVKCIPPIGAGVEVLSRQVYIALWDGEKVLSNIHVVRAVPLEKDFTWTFTPKVGKNVPTLFDGELLVRIDSDNHKLSVLLEFNYTYRRTSTSEESNICCGWTSLPLFEVDGQPAANKNYELEINGGTPFQENVVLDPSISLAASQTLFESLIRTNRQPRATVKLSSINKTTQEIYDTLPQTLVACQRHASFISMYRYHAASVYCRGDSIPSQGVCDPILAYFPRVLGTPDLMDALKIAWDENVKTNLTRTQRRNQLALHAIFKQSFTESAFGLSMAANMPPVVWANDAHEKARQSFVQTFVADKDQLGHLLSAEYKHKPFDIRQVSCSLFTQHNQPVPLLDRENLFYNQPQEDLV